MLRKDMLNIAHRGFRSRYPENTMLAFKKAVGAGCDGIEFDVHLSKDGEAVIIHDETVDRTTDGTGLVGQKNYRELKALNAAKPHPETVDFAPIPSLREYFEYMAEQPDIISNIELKTGVFVYEGIEEVVYRLMKEYGLIDRCIVSSFNHESVLRMKQIDSAVVCGLLVDSWQIRPELYVRELGIECYHPSAYCVTPKLVAALHNAGVRINPWFGSIQCDYRQLIEMGVDSLITDYPEKITALLKDLQRVETD
ncbi:glycerophosphodiester phosphodiesterase [Treponema vincentii]|uniref:glycerophosphodiester phosphodiesterase n=1 Tax=Treponema vincentii TaxID=69710 RepID=UPI0035F58B28